MFSPLVSTPPRGRRPGGPGDGSLDAGSMGMWLLLASLSVIFIAGLIAYVYIRTTSDQWPERQNLPLPPGLWLSTITLLASSFAVHRAVLAIRRADRRRLLRWMLLTTLLGAAFLALQGWNWLVMVRGGQFMQNNLFLWLFYVLSGLHAAHVLGGLLPLAVVTARATGGTYTATTHSGVRYCAMYWHFLDVTWLCIVAALLMR